MMKVAFIFLITLFAFGETAFVKKSEASSFLKRGKRSIHEECVVEGCSYEEVLEWYDGIHAHASAYWATYTDVNECASTSTNDCHSNAICVNTAGSYKCVCTSGYTGSGQECTETNN